MPKHREPMEDSNRSGNATIHTVSDPARRQWVQGGLGAAASTLLAPIAGVLAGSGCAGPAAAEGPRLGFESVPVSTADTVAVPAGYTAQVIAPWGDPVGLPGFSPPWRADASHTAADQAAQLGMHHDGMHFYALPGRDDAGLLAINHEYTDEGLLHADGMATWSAEKVRKSQAAHGVSVIEVRRDAGGWSVVRPSRWARRITAGTPMAFGGPAAGHALLRTALDPQGRTPLGTLNNCGSGKTPWGTYLTCEENFIGYFRGPDTPDAHARRWGLRPGDGYGQRWHEHDERFDATRHPNEPNRFGWVVEIDPFDPGSTPVKRTALGRAAHEGATVALTRDGRAVVYSGEDAAFESIYKFVSRDRVAAGGAAANRSLLDHGTLYVARFDAGGRGRWLPLVQGRGPLTAAAGFADQGEVLVRARQASDALGATKMDRPEWIAVDRDGRVYCSLTNNRRRGVDAHPAPDAANPRARNTMGHVIRWKEDGDFDAEAFGWDHFVLAGDPAAERPEARGNVRGDAFGCPDGLWADARGLLWIQTDISPSSIGRGEHARLGHNAMLAADPRSGEVRRFLTGPRGCEITGATMSPDGRTMFINIQHPGELPSYRNDPAAPLLGSSWPDGQGRPRSATVVIRKNDGGPIGT